MIRRLYVDNFRCLVNFEFKPDRVNVILGKNGSGKSTLFDALRAIGVLLNGASIQSILPPETLPWWDTRRAQTFELTIDDPAGAAAFSYRVVIRHTDEEAPKIVEERLSQGAQTLLSFENGSLDLAGVEKGIPFDGKQSVLALGLGRDPALARFRASVVGVLVFRLNPWAFETLAREEQRGLMVNGANLVAYLRSWSQSAPKAFLKWRDTVLEGMPQLEDIQLRELVPGSRILVGVRHVGNRETLLSLDSFSEGERALLALHAVSGLSSPGRVIALDEPDNFLSPSEVQPVLRSFTVEVSDESRAQLLIVTHHPESIDYLAAYSTWLFERGNDGLARVRSMTFDREKGERPTDSLLAELSPGRRSEFAPESGSCFW